MKPISDITDKTPLILIVDDVTDNLKVIGSILMKENYHIIPASNGKLAINIARAELPDLILLDIMMPEMDGFEVCRILKSDKLTQDIPVIFLTAKTDAENIIQGFETGGEDYITKPFEHKELLARVNTHINLKLSLKKLTELISTKDRLFSIITHDIKGPFSAMVRVSDNLTRLISEAKDLDRVQETSVLLNQSIRNAYELLDNLLQWSSSQTGRLENFPVKLDLKEIADSCLKAITSQALNKNIKLNNNVPEKVTVISDINLLRTIIRNLVSNALKYTNPQGNISINCRVVKKQAEITVADTGVGIAPERLKNLFNLNYKSITLGTDNEKGTGLGLILCKEFAEKLGTKITVQSEPGTGSQFSFKVPVS